MASYEEVKDLPNHPEITLIDVRSPEEIESSGAIPTSINIPLADLETALQQSNDAFKEVNGRDLPDKESLIILTCRSGRRAVTAEETLKNLGWTNTKVYAGSWLEWAEKEGLPATTEVAN